MHNCQSLDPLVTSFVDGELPDADRHAVEEHLRACPACHSRVAAERAVHDLLRTRKASLCKAEAPDALHARCAAFVQANLEPRTSNAEFRTQNSEFRTPNAERRTPTLERGGPTAPLWRRERLVPLTLAASLIAVVGGAFVYQATDKSARVLAAELVADHAKCFALNGALGTHQMPSAVEQSMASAFDWRMHLPEHPDRAGLELVGAR